MNFKLRKTYIGLNFQDRVLQYMYVEPVMVSITKFLSKNLMVTLHFILEDNHQDSAESAYFC